jgi:dipeptidyl aminopeptidase/acylaminoacyl peptidase
MNHYVVHPRRPPQGVEAWVQDLQFGALRVHLEWAAPAGAPGPLPAVLVHPEAGKTAKDMRGVVLDLASRGYLAVAADYTRLIDGRWQRTLFPFRQEGDLTRALQALRAEPRGDRSRIALMGFSQGGVFSLIMAGHAPDVTAVVAYYPVTDFERWMEDPSYSKGRRWIFGFIRRHFYKKSGAKSEEEFRQILDRASPLKHADRIACPVLLVHGTDDTTAPISESRRMADALRARDVDVTLLEVAGAGHVFNFLDKSAPQARFAWSETLAWLDRRMGAPAPARAIPPDP